MQALCKQWIPLVLATLLGKRYYFLLLTNEEIEALMGDMTLPMSRDKYAGLGRSN